MSWDKVRPVSIYSSSYPADDKNDTSMTWDAESLSLAASRTVSVYSSSTLDYKFSQKRASTSSFATVRTMSSVETARERLRPVRRSSLKEILVKSLSFVTMLPRISSARNELATMRRSAVAAPLYQQTKLLDDLLDATRDALPYHIRKSALRLVHYSFANIIQDIFTAATRQQFLKTLKGLCSDELSFTVRHEGLTHFNYLIGAGACLNGKSFVIEYENCRTILNMLKTTTNVSLKLAACSYLWLSWNIFRGRVYSPVSEKELRSVCIILVDLTQHPLPVGIRRDALDWLWRFEAVQTSDLSDKDKRLVGASILEISGYTESNGLLYFQYVDVENDYLSGLRRLWWFITLRSWGSDMQYEKKMLRKVGADLLSITESSRSHELRKQGFELLALFSNLAQWHDMFDESTRRFVSKEFAEFCLRDADRVNKDEVMRRVEKLLVRSTSPESDSKEVGHRALVLRKELPLSKRMSTVSRYNQETAANKAVQQYCGAQAGTTVEAALENLAVFTLPGESLLIQKDQQAILYERICNYAGFNQTRLIAVQAMYALLTIQEWLSGITFAKGPPKGCD